MQNKGYSLSPETHSQLANFIWSICNLLRGPYKRNEYLKVILPLAMLRRFNCLFAPREGGRRITIVSNGSPCSLVEARS